MGKHLNDLCTFPDLWVWFLVKILFFLSFFGISGFKGVIFRKFSGCLAILFRNVSRFMGDILTI